MPYAQSSEAAATRRRIGLQTVCAAPASLMCSTLHPANAQAPRRAIGTFGDDIRLWSCPPIPATLTGEREKGVEMHAVVAYESMYGNTRKTPGLREWLASLGRLHVHAAVFDTRLKAPAVVSGRASRGITRELRRHGVAMLTKPESFLVTRIIGSCQAKRIARERGDGSWLLPLPALFVPAALPIRDPCPLGSA